MSNASLSEVLSCLQLAETVAITVHGRPDGDAIGSQLALGSFLERKGKTVHMINADPPPYNLDWLPGRDRLQEYDGSVAQLDALSRADVLVVADTNSESRIGKHGAFFRQGPGTSLLIDHHTDPESWFDMMYRRETASSTGELVWEIISAWDANTVNELIATCLYTAIMTDTGSFRYSNVTPKLHRDVANLMERGDLDSSRIHAEVYDKRSPEGMRLMGRVLETLRLDYDGQVGSMAVTRTALADTGAPSEESEGIVNMILSLEGVRVALLFKETEKGTKISFRSKADDHVHQWAQALGGGGHRNASGAFVNKPLVDTIRRAIELAPRFLDLTTEEESDSEDLSAEDAAYLSVLMDMKQKS